MWKAAAQRTKNMEQLVPQGTIPARSSGKVKDSGLEYNECRKVPADKSRHFWLMSSQTQGALSNFWPTQRPIGCNSERILITIFIVEGYHVTRVVIRLSFCRPYLPPKKDSSLRTNMTVDVLSSSRMPTDTHGRAVVPPATKSISIAIRNRDCT